MDPLDILVVDDEASICLLLRDLLARFQHRVETCQDARVALELVEERKFDLIFLDVRMPGMNGVEALKALKEECPEAIFIMITGYAGTDVLDECMSSGASACLGKPFSISQVIQLLKQIAAGEPIAAG
jgi:two-component system response regulator HydG